MSVTFRQVERDEEVEALAHMAYHIWNEYWPAIIGQAQTDYMVEKFQSLNAFRTDIADNGYEYFFIMQHEDETPHELGPAASTTTSNPTATASWPATPRISPAPPPSPASSATPVDTWRRTRTASSSRRSTC